MILGAIIAGGQSRRFGSDKALAEIAGKPLLQRVADALGSQTDALIVCGREWPGLVSVPDRPGPDQGPLGGICAALHYAADHGFDAVLTAGCDTLPVPGDLTALLRSSPERGGGPRATARGGGAAPNLVPAPPPAAPVPLPVPGRIIAGQPLFGLWPATLAGALDHYLASQGDRSMRGWIAASGAQSVACDVQFHNLNTPQDLALYARTQGLAA